MKRILSSFSLLALLLVTTAALANGRPTGIRIGHVEGSGGSTNPTVAVDVTITGTDTYYPTNGFSTTVWLDNTIWTAGFGNYDPQYASGSFAEPLPGGAIDWGDGEVLEKARLFGPPGGPFRGRFSHSYSAPGRYTITAGDAVGPNGTGSIQTGNVISGTVRYLYDYFGTTYDTFGPYTSPVPLAITATTVVSTGFGIPTLDVYGLIAMALVLVGAGLLVYRRPQPGAV